MTMSRCHDVCCSGEGVICTDFGGEGTGRKSMLDTYEESDGTRIPFAAAQSTPYRLLVSPHTPDLPRSPG